MNFEWHFWLLQTCGNIIHIVNQEWRKQDIPLYFTVRETHGSIEGEDVCHSTISRRYAIPGRHVAETITNRSIIE